METLNDQDVQTPPPAPVTSDSSTQPSRQSGVVVTNADVHNPPPTITASPAPAATEPLNKYANPEDQPADESFALNKEHAKAGPYTTQLAPKEETALQNWVKTNKVPWTDDPKADYDMRGYYSALKQGKVKQEFNKWDKKMHFPDTYKTPYGGTFSDQSQYALPTAPRWEGDKLMTHDGKLIVDETPKAQPKGKVEPTPAKAAPKLAPTLHASFGKRVRVNGYTGTVLGVHPVSKKLFVAWDHEV